MGLQTPTQKPFLFFIRQITKFPVLLWGGLILLACSVSLELMTVNIYGKIIDYLNSTPLGEGFWDGAMHYFTIILLTMVGFNIFIRSTTFVIYSYFPKVETRIKGELFEYVQSNSPNYFANNLAGQLGHKVNQIANSCGQMINIMTWGIIEPVYMVAVSVFIIAIESTSIALIFLAISIIFVAISWLISITQKQASANYADAKSAISGKIIDAFTNILSIKSFGRARYELTNMHKHLQHERSKGIYYNHLREYQRLVQGITLLIMHAVIIYYSLYEYNAGNISLGIVVMIITLSIQNSHYLWMMGMHFGWMFEHIGTIQDGLSYVAKPIEIEDVRSAKPLKVRKAKVEFKDINFSYPGTDHVIRNFSLTIKPGEKIGLVGHSGAGKSTIINMLMRYYELDEGHIFIDGQDIKQVQQESLRQHIALIPQDTQLFHRTLYDNIGYGNPKATKAQIVKAAKQAHAHEFIKKIPEQYDALVGERGVKLSGGQRQRIAITRAILKDAPILVLDEATSALDSESEKLIQASLQSLMKGKTVIAIAHRLSTLRHMDRILVLDKGRVIEEGSHAQLIRKKNGTYAKLWSLQSGDILEVG